MVLRVWIDGIVVFVNVVGVGVFVFLWLLSLSVLYGCFLVGFLRQVGFLFVIWFDLVWLFCGLTIVAFWLSIGSCFGGLFCLVLAVFSGFWWLD